MRERWEIKANHIIGFCFIGILGYIIISSIVIADTVFVGPTQKIVEIPSEWEVYVKNRRARNARAMKVSYEELMSIGQELKSNNEWKDAIEAYTMAKSIYPTAIEPRLELCYLYLRKCEHEGGYCVKGKREIYYALQHVKQDDNPSREYLDTLVSHTNLSDIVILDEASAMEAIF